jgi:hypothetical protein
MNITNPRNLIWSDESGDSVDLIVDIEGVGEAPFTASKNDPEPHGRELFERAVSGEFGAIQDYVPPLPPTTEQLAYTAREKRNKLLDESDWTQMPDAPVDKTVWNDYRQSLRDITEQSGFPENIAWPTKPL